MRFSFFHTSSNSFDGQKDTETVILVLRNHWFTLFIRLLGFLLAAVIPPFLSLILIIPLFELGIFSLFMFALAIYYLVLWYGAFYVITMYLLDVVVVTDERIVDMTQKGFFVHDVAELHVSRIQDASTVVEGVIATYFDYGLLVIQTAGTEQKFHFENIPHPEKVKEIVMDLADKAHARQV